MKRIFVNISFLIALVLASSCDNYTDINQNPNDVLYTNLTPDELLSAAQSNVYRTQAASMNQYGNILTNAWSGNSNLYGAGVFGTSEYTLNFTSTFLNGVWDNLYLGVNNFQKIIDNKNNQDHSYDNYIAVSKICKSHYMQYIVDLYGDCPYTEAFNGPVNVTPKYDNDEDIYKALILELESAYTMLDAPNANALPLDSSKDIMLAGDLDKWKKFAATIELRMLLRMSNTTGSTAAFRDAHLNGFLASKQFVDESVAVNPGYNSASSAAYNPYYYNFISTTPTKLGPSGHAYKCLNNDWTGSSSTEVVSGSGVYYPNVNDPRNARLFRTGTGATKVCAVTQGNIGGCDVYPTTYTAVNKPLGNLGYGPANPYLAISGATTGYSAANGYVMTLAESEFLQAEAHLRGYFGGNYASAKVHFDNGITDSFKFLLGPNTTNLATTINTYITSISPKVNFGMGSTNTFNQNLCAIMYQKWVALIGVHGMESYIEYTRTGYPVTPLSTSSTRTSKPLRLIYPASEYSNNSANVVNISSEDIFSINAYTPFWKH
jgi:hypothetical protein